MPALLQYTPVVCQAVVGRIKLEGQQVKSACALEQDVQITQHGIDCARKVCDRVVFMYQGRVHETGAPAQVFSDSQTAELKQFLGMIQ